jgi:hypothetical protein
VEPAVKKGYRQPSYRQFGLRMDKELEAALMASASANERTLCQEARFHLKRGLGLVQAPAEASIDVVSA